MSSTGGWLARSASSTFRRASAETYASLSSARETVFGETPASGATSTLRGVDALPPRVAESAVPPFEDLLLAC